MKKFIEFDGVRFCLDEKTGYYHGYLRKGVYDRLHRYIYEFYNGKLPDGYDVHHKDFDKNNNNLSNLVALPKSEHVKIHMSNLSEERLQKMRDNIAENVRPKASEWHGSKEGREWHKVHYEQMKDKLHQKHTFVCKNCGKEFDASRKGFCSNACKSAYRRKLGVDNVTRKCALCGKEFNVNKYAKIRCCSHDCSVRLMSILRRIKTQK